MAPHACRNNPEDDAATEKSASQLDAASRRRIQNRLNQRASREWHLRFATSLKLRIDTDPLHSGKKKAVQLEKEDKIQQRRWVFYTNEANAFAEHGAARDKKIAQPALKLEDPPIQQPQIDPCLCTATQITREQHWVQLRRKVAESAASNLQSPNLLLPVAQYNIMRAMLANAASMGLTMEILSEDIASYFNIAGPVTLCLPPSLQPSASQKQIIHHPWIDLIPIASFRNTLLSKLDKYNEEELCGDLYGVCGSSREVGLIVWGEAWDPTAYEVSEAVAKKWSWLLRDCPELLKSTNYWRKQRGEKPLQLTESVEHCIEEITD